jgi:Fe-S-cluster containining protein
MIPKLKASQKEKLKVIYADMSDGSTKCDTACNKCCIDGSIHMTYAEFALLFDDMTDEQVKKVFEKPATIRGEKYEPCPLIDHNGKCSRYESRSWICRAYKHDDLYGCMTTRRTDPRNFLAESRIFELNKCIDIPDKFDKDKSTSKKEMRQIFECFK